MPAATAVRQIVSGHGDDDGNVPTSTTACPRQPPEPLPRLRRGSVAEMGRRMRFEVLLLPMEMRAECVDIVFKGTK
ncbi:hypothetical protein U9M48_030761 [Paspalum notatum var. saurae]|uniref:Uncharacterized protein n=1 Tax=Paspalum notatum var. saurae TaxID=547442 RepID=A0AAQ3U1I9_PASNO